MPVNKIQAPTADDESSQLPVLSIAIWGWQGDGKTTSLLTAVHYAEPPDTALGFAPVRERDELDEVASREEYRGLGLVHIANASTKRIDTLQKEFIDGRTWPAGTDTGEAYLLRVEDVAKTRAFAIVVDLPGGSYSEHDAVAEAVIDSAHVIMMMVRPERWMAGDLGARAYKNMVRYRVRRCIQRRVPVCLLVAQADRSPDDAQHVTSELQSLLDVLNSDSPARVFRVSVIGDDITLPPSDGPPLLPAPAERQPHQMVESWVWTLTKALEVEATSPSPRVPVVELARTAHGAASKPDPLPESRLVAEFSDMNGEVLCALPTRKGSPSFLTMASDGNLAEVELDSTATVPRVSTLGQLEPPIDQLTSGATGSVVGRVFAGVVIVGNQRNPSHVWCGHIHDLVRRMDLPTDLLSWTPISAELITGVDAQGRLHLLRKTNNAWRQVAYLADFVEDPDNSYCVYNPRSRVLEVGDGQGQAAVLVEANAFGPRVNAPVRASYDDVSALLVGVAGSVADIDKGRDVYLTNLEDSWHCGEAHPTAEVWGALAHSATDRMAWVDPELRLRVSTASRTGTKTSDELLSATLPSTPRNMVWAYDDSVLAVDLGDGIWQIYRPMGL